MEIWLVIIGGLIGIAGTLFSLPLGAWLNERAETRKRRIEKLEELIEVIYEYDHWLDIQRGIKIFGNDGVSTLTPISRAIALAAIHFPQFNTMIKELDLVASKYELWMLERGSQRVAGNVANLTDGFEEVHQPYLNKRSEVITSLKEYAKSEFGT